MRSTKLSKTAQNDWRDVMQASSCNAFATATFSNFICSTYPAPVTLLLLTKLFLCLTIIDKICPFVLSIYAEALRS